MKPREEYFLGKRSNQDNNKERANKKRQEGTKDQRQTKTTNPQNKIEQYTRYINAPEYYDSIRLHSTDQIKAKSGLHIPRSN